MFSRNDKLVMHEKKCKNGEQFTCDECDKTFANMYNLERHRKVLHKESANKYECSQCVKSFTRKDNFKKHILKYHAE